MEEHKPISGMRAVTIGCGLGDDAEAMSRYGYQVTAFDISPSAIEMCRKRYPDSGVEYIVADLFALPTEWQHGFNLVYECNTIQIKSEFPDLRIVGLSMFEDDQSAKSIISAGADAFVPKTASSAKLLKAIYRNRE
jgi:DNA-binding NarL/FixJ family response regulator